ncbi:MAG: hypothetical protein ABL977_13030 [Candidatus Eisenbacteria bacterium]
MIAMGFSGCATSGGARFAARPDDAPSLRLPVHQATSIPMGTVLEVRTRDGRALKAFMLGSRPLTTAKRDAGGRALALGTGNEARIEEQAQSGEILEALASADVPDTSIMPLTEVRSVRVYASRRALEQAMNRERSESGSGVPREVAMMALLLAVTYLALAPFIGLH